MTAPLGMDCWEVTGGGDGRMLFLSASLISSEVASGDGWFTWPLIAPTGAEGVLRCLVK